jgi:hypoxanthine phosphoribosyltransferase
MKTSYPILKVGWGEIYNRTKKIAAKLIEDKKQIDLIVPIIRGGMPIAMILSNLINVSEMACIHIRRSVSDSPNSEFLIPTNKGITNSEKINGANVLIVDDILDSKITLDYAIKILQEYKPKSITVAILYNFNRQTFKEVYSGYEAKKYSWVVFPWESE